LSAPTTTWEQDRALLARRSQDLPSDHPELTELRRKIKAKRLELHVAEAVASAPPLTAEQRDRIAAILRGGGDAT
jgi:hypothetical protein